MTDLWVNTRTGERFKVTATSSRPWSLPDRPTAENMAKATEPWPGEAITRPLTPEQWAAFCERHGEDPEDPDAFCVTPPNRLRRMMAEFLAA
jgi:hypothetical protein